MESWQIVGSLYGAVLGYLALSNIQQGKQMAVMSKQLDTLTMQVSMFIKTEVDTLKELVKR